MHTKQPSTYIVSGSSSGIGKAITLSLLEQGHRVVGVSRNASEFSAPGYQAVNLDLAAITSLPKQLEQLALKYTQIDGIIFCAGSGRFGSLEEFSFKQIQTLLEINLTSQIYLTRAFLPILKKQKHGDLIYIGSESAKSGGKRGAIYAASKFGLRGFTQALRQECANKSIRVTIINPGMVRTKFFDKLDFEPGDHRDNAIEAEDVAAAALMVLQMPAGTVIDEINLSPQKKVVQSKNQ